MGTTMNPMSLQEIVLVKIGILVWMRKEMKIFMNKQSNGLIKLEKGLHIVKTSISEFPITVHLRDRLIHFVERIGYELYVFLSKSIINIDFGLSNIKWEADGVINETATLHACIQEANKYTLSDFRSACIVFDESLVKKIWYSLTEEERKSSRASFRYLLLPSYWIYFMDNRLTNFPEEFGSLIIGYDGFSSLNVNMLRHCIAVNNNNAIYYFQRKLSENDIASLQLSPDMSINRILKYALKNLPSESLKFILNFLEKPIVHEDSRILILNEMRREHIKNFLDYVLRQVNVFGDLHYNIFRHFLFSVRHRCPGDVRENLDFYALNLISKGRLDKFEYLQDLNPRKILQRQISYRLKHGRGLAIISTINFNKHTELLRSFLEWLAENEEDRKTFRDSLNAIVEGVQYDLPL
ncbi:UNVERIFIED_CONTAM: hypothetical protein PYX00_000962 [Menopon gallinae]|uniref:Uncharacterized protein n=1 Tax=Menopon gallinae TaxID=328185 RepID=A0AAW2IC78_9NEOP